jgi:hypothetical protein
VNNVERKVKLFELHRKVELLRDILAREKGKQFPEFERPVLSVLTSPFTVGFFKLEPSLVSKVKMELLDDDDMKGAVNSFRVDIENLLSKKLKDAIQEYEDFANGRGTE